MGAAAGTIFVASVVWLALQVVWVGVGLTTLGFAAITMAGLLGSAPRRLGVDPAAIFVQSYWGSLEFPWSALGPSPRLPRGRWGVMRANLDEGRRPRAFWINVDQARTLLTHPSCPAGRFPDAYWDWIGVPRRLTLPSG